MKLKRVLKYAASTVGIFIIAGLIVLFFNGCKNFGSPNYTLTVVIESGAQGTPASGTYTYKDLSVIDYEYTAINPENTIQVLINGGKWSSKSSITMYTDTKLVAKLFDIRAKWSMSMKPTLTTDPSYKFNITFVGTGYLSGTFHDDQGPGLGYIGTWTISDGALTIKYSDWKDYVLTGDASSMTGSWTGESKVGTWSATLVQ
jgi:hypothetical protein